MNAGEGHTKATRERIRRSILGRTRTQETRRRMSEAQQRRRARERETAHQRRVRLLYEARTLEIEADALREREIEHELSARNDWRSPELDAIEETT